MFLISNFQSFLPFIIGISAIAVIVFCSYYFSAKQIIIRTLERTRTKSLKSVQSDEFIKVTGKALHVKEPLEAPLSKRKCIFYSIRIEQKKSNGKNSYWKTIVNDEQFHEFFVENNGEYVIVKPIKEPRNFISYLVTDKDASSGTFNDPTPAFESLLKRYNVESTGFFGFNKQLKYTEGIIAVGEIITVAGIAKWKQLNEPIAENSHSKIISLECGIKQKIIITDFPLTDRNS